MDDLISRQAAIDKIKEQIIARLNWLSDSRMERQGLDVALCVIEDLPSAQPERKKGHWIVVSDGYGNGEATACICECSVCKDTIWVYKKANRKWNFCSNCGAKMGEMEGEM